MVIRTVVDMFRARIAESGPRPALRWKEGGIWRSSTWNDWDAAARAVAAALIPLGVEPRDRVAILANSCPAWVKADIGILFAGACSVPIYHSSTPEQIEYVINNSGSKVVFAEDPVQVEKLFDPEVRPKIQGVVRVVCFSPSKRLDAADKKGRTEVRLQDVVPAEEREWVVSFADFLDAGKKALAAGAAEEVERRASAVEPEDVCTIVYTSGTTGPPKGVILDHDNFAFESDVFADLLGVGEEDEQLLFLPLAHIFAKLTEIAGIRFGYRTAFAEGPLKAVDNAAEVRPTFFGSIPRLFEKVRATAWAKARAEGGVKLRIFEWAIRVGTKVSKLRQAGREPDGLLALQHKVADRLVFSKVRERFGGRIKFIISGGAPLAAELAEFFHAVGILVLEGYGMTETTAATNINLPTKFRFGTVGPVLPRCEIRIAPDGEILMRGRNMTRGYWERPEDTREAYDADGWFHSGDVGEIDKDGFLRITDRKKDLIVTAGGKNIAPQNLEGAVKRCAYVSQVVVHGDGRRFLSALLTLDPDAIRGWAARNGVTVGALSTDPRVRSLIQDEMDKVNSRLATYEQIRKFAILDRDFTIDDGELTPSLKVKRKAITEKYLPVLDAMYAETGTEGRKVA